MTNIRPTHTLRILHALELRANQWIPMPTLARLSKTYAVHSRISELRTKHGLTIEHKNERKDGVVLSFYKLVREVNQPVGANS